MIVFLHERSAIRPKPESRGQLVVTLILYKKRKKKMKIYNCYVSFLVNAYVAQRKPGITSSLISTRTFIQLKKS